jgi:hypothetical protein
VQAKIIRAGFKQLSLGLELMFGRVDIVRELERGVKCGIPVEHDEGISDGGEINW